MCLGSGLIGSLLESTFISCTCENVHDDTFEFFGTWKGHMQCGLVDESFGVASAACANACSCPGHVMMNVTRRVKIHYSRKWIQACLPKASCRVTYV